MTVIALAGQLRLPFVAVRPLTADRRRGFSDGASPAHPYTWLQILTQNRWP
jgi:hypothetical protein